LALEVPFISILRLSEIIAKAWEDASQSQDLQRLSPLGAFPKRLAIVPRGFDNAGTEGSNNTAGASIVFQFQPTYNPEIDYEKRARL
jgi:hypothetical protein